MENHFWNYGQEQISVALDILLTWDGDKRKGLASAWDDRLHRIAAENVPASVWEQLVELRDDLTTVESSSKSWAEASAEKLSDERLNEHLSRMAYWPFEFIDD